MSRRLTAEADRQAGGWTAQWTGRRRGRSRRARLRHYDQAGGAAFDSPRSPRRRAELAADVPLIGAASIPLERVICELPALGPSSVETGQLP